MNKKNIFAAAFLLFFIFLGNSFPQNSITLQIFQPLPEIDFGSMLIQNNLSGVPKVFYVSISPAGKNVYVRGYILWDKNDGNGFRQVFSFLTEKFVSKNFYSDELGSSGLRIASHDANSSLTEEILKKGKPTGTYRFQLQLLNENQVYLTETSQDVTFSNPSQTLLIITPESGSSQAVGSVIARWSKITGVDKYKIKLNVRTSPAQSLEEALNSGTPLINNKIIEGGITSVDLRSYLDREWLPGQELVLQVSAVVEGLGGGSTLPSEIISFSIAASAGNTVKSDKESLIALLYELKNDQALQFASLLSNVSMDNVKFYNNEGGEITFAQFQSIINSILSSIVKITIVNQ